MEEYEISGIENISRGICLIGNRVLLCRGKGLDSTYLPGGHIEFGEKGREALVREMKEETGCAATAGAFVTVVENSFLQHGRKHCEINLVYEMELDGIGRESAVPPPVVSKEEWIGFEWCDIGELDKANLLPTEMRDLVSAVARRPPASVPPPV